MKQITVHYEQKPDGQYVACMEVPGETNACLALMILESQSLLILQGLDAKARDAGYQSYKEVPKGFKEKLRLDEIIQMVPERKTGQ
jgi:hypothetical protein